MAYPKSFHRLVLFGTYYGDIWNTSLSIVPNAVGEINMIAVSEQHLEDVATTVGEWFTSQYGASNGPSFVSTVKLNGIKLNRINAAGRYEDFAEPRTWTYPTPLSGGGSSASVVAPQLALVSTLRTAIASGPAAKGRMYMPPSTAMTSLDPATGLVTTAYQEVAAQGTVELLRRINDEYILIGRAGVASNSGAGRFEHVTHVSVGRVVDTMRSRRNKLREEPELVAVP